jgi:hypothetical protein
VEIEWPCGIRLATALSNNTSREKHLPDKSIDTEFINMRFVAWLARFPFSRFSKQEATKTDSAVS